MEADMSGFHSESPDSFNYSPFKMIGKDWMLVTAEKEGKVNTMTASWGGLGVMWGRNVAFIVVRPSRFTKEFMDASDSFSLTFFDREKYSKMLGYMGSVSGRKEDKIKVSGLTVEHYEGTPYFAEASKAILCRKIFRQPIDPNNFIADDIDSKWYPEQDYHDLYIGEVTEILSK